MNGENQYTFSYFGHIKWILSDWIDNPTLLLQSHKCIDCQYFGMYSRWVMLWLYLILLPGQLLIINPFVWYLFISFASQYVAIKYFLESLFPRSQINNSFLIALSAFFTTIPYKWVQIGTQWEYPFIYFMFFVMGGTYMRLLRNEKLTRPHLLLTSLAALLIFNVGINHLPIVFYTLILLSTIAFITSHTKTFLLKTLGAIYVPSLILNLPMIISIITNSDITEFSNFYSHNWHVLLSFGYLASIHSSKYIAAVALLGSTTIVISYLALKKREFIVFASLLIFGLSLGILGKGFIFQLIFDNVPLFRTLRSAYRFIIFEHIFLIILIGYLYVHTKKSRFSQALKHIFIVMCALNLLFISVNDKTINFTRIPDAYEDVYKLISKDERRYFYLPSGLNVHHSISVDYTFGNSAANFYWWQNPYESWYPSRNIHHPTHNITDADLDKKIFELYSKNSQNDLIKVLKNAGVDYIIFDGYYRWSREVPEFNVNTFLKRDELQMTNKLGEIKIYSVR